MSARPAAGVPVAAQAEQPQQPPLSHHDILGLVGPFTAAGWALDLAASQRLARRLVFCPAAALPDVPAQQLVLEGLASGSWQLTRHAQQADGAAASVQALGLAPAALLALVQAVPVARHFVSGPGRVLARSYRVLPGGPVVLTRGVLRAGGMGNAPGPTTVTSAPLLVLTLDVAPVRGVAAEIALQAPHTHLALPEDLVAVLGWHWTRLVPGRPAGGAWASKLRLPGGLPARTARAEAALDRAAAHLAQTLAEAPARFHERHRLRRLGVMLRRAIPLLTPLLLVATILLMPRVDTSEHMGLWLLLYHVPTALIVLSFCLQELPTLRPPPWPRRSTASDWRQS